MAKQSSEMSGWVGWIFFAGFMMILQGTLNVLAGLTALFNDEWLVATESNLLFFDFTTWGWVHMILGALVLWAGFAVMRGSVFARSIGVVVAFFSAVAALASIDIYPVWSLVLVVVDVLIIFALTVHGDELVES